MSIHHPVLGSRFFYLLVSLIAYFTITPLFISHEMSYQIISVLFSFVIIFSANIVMHGKKIVAITLTLGALSFTGTWYVDISQANSTLNLLHFIVTIMFLSTITCSVIYAITKHQAISADTLLGAICGYLLIGATWSFIYLILSDINPSALTDNFIALNPSRRLQDATYFSFTTLTTTGFGDILPRSSMARVWAWLEAVTGQLYLAVWISRLVGLQIAQKFPQKS